MRRVTVKMPNRTFEATLHGWGVNYEELNDKPAHFSTAIVEDDQGEVYTPSADSVTFLTPPMPTPGPGRRAATIKRYDKEKSGIVDVPVWFHAFVNGYEEAQLYNEALQRYEQVPYPVPMAVVEHQNGMVEVTQAGGVTFTEPPEGTKHPILSTQLSTS